MASRRIALSAALRGRAVPTAAPAPAPAPAPRVPRAAFGAASSGAPRTITRATIARPTTVGRTATAQSSSRGARARWISDAPQGTKIWSFEEIQSLTTHPGSTPRVVLIDAREPSELAQTGRIPGALNVPVASAPDSFHVPADEFEDRYGAARPDPTDVLVFYCKAGVRSRAAATIAKEAGYKNVGEYPGSWVDWVARGGKVER
ncbi:Rhodanese-like protein [Hypoxylon cercidicola]|nr:Rhodanese-like protein [Hypoxylon cercidicola]